MRETEAGKLLSIVFVKLAYYAPSTAQNFWKLCPNYARFSKLCSSPQNYATWFFGQIKTEQGGIIFLSPDDAVDRRKLGFLKDFDINFTVV